MELTNFAPSRSYKISDLILIGSVIINVCLVIALCLSFGAAEQGLAAPVSRATVPSMPSMATRVSRGDVMKGAMAGIAGALAGAVKTAQAGSLSDKSVKKICSANPTASVCIKPGGYEEAKKR
mmetsp:Transcript_23017/g.34286  ORF Transcript_23017/g.34286 Transcript_23017/m.34286 type:complete len:123 (+) Transcript_23017:64-432(+)|eukprot:CAMPEP_0167745690 /NCGR_PEP_ID=MMETSP0110_2-20121227/3292_1 /TAXON_ID=629695 /ORGANISM="Gymnochlora sp., Strain CCMP2014" /LENGTH=122 /DNA_ID=CAMNT_0007630361 /DNA_START=43 /DNA_END=411 /DNA_ORIENTATION=+